MTDLLSELATPSDAELISSVRGGDVAAYGDLFARHRDAANRLARQLVRGPDADDLVSEAFAKVLSVLQGGGGPDVAFRAYLLTAVRRLHVDRMRAGAKVQTSDDMEAFDPGVPFHDTAIANFESGAAARAFATLPERWQLVLWHLEVEGNKPADIAPLLGMSANSVSALAYRAREGLRQAFLTMHLSDISDTDCRWVNEHLGAYVRKGLSNRDSTKVQGHLDQCRRCTAMYLELTEVNSNLAAIIAPLLLGAAATGYLAAAGGASAGGFGLVAALGRVRDAVAANAGAATVGGVAASVVAATTVGVMMLPSSPEKVVAADKPATAEVPAAPAEATSQLPQPREQRKVEESPEADVAEVPDAVQPVAVPAADPTTDVPTEEPVPPTETAPADEPSPTDEPSPSEEPSPSDEPAPTQAPTPTEQPSPTAEPTPAGPATTTPVPTTPPPSTPPATTPPVAPTLTFAGSPVYVDGRVSFALSGTPLPPVVTVEIASDPAGITFDLNGTGTACTVVSTSQATCPTGSGAGSALLRSSVVSDTELTDELPLVAEPGQPDSRVDVWISAEGLTRVLASFDYAGVADVRLAALDLMSPEPDPVTDLYHVTATLAGVEGLPFVRLRLDPDSAATLDSTSDCTLADAKTLICYTPDEGEVIDLYLAAPILADTDVTVTLEAPSDYTETAPANDSRPVTLPHTVDVQLTSAETVAVQGSRTTVRAHVSGVPASATGVVLSLSGPFTGEGPDQFRFLTGAGGTDGADLVDCVATAWNAVTCRNLPADGSFFIDVDVFHPSGQPARSVDLTVTAEGVTEPSARLANNTRPVTID